MRLLTLLLLLLALCNCAGETAARKAARGPAFVAEPNRLYFKNTRTRHYSADEAMEYTVVYRHHKLLASEATVVPAIVDQWLEDRATLRFEVRPDPTDQAEPRPFRLDLKRGNTWKTLPLTTPPTLEEIQNLRHHLATQQDLRVVMGLDTLPPFPGKAREYAKTTLDDYLRLVGAN